MGGKDVEKCEPLAIYILAMVLGHGVHIGILDNQCLLNSILVIGRQFPYHYIVLSNDCYGGALAVFGCHGMLQYIKKTFNLSLLSSTQ